MRAGRWARWFSLLLGACGAEQPAPATAVRLTLSGGPNPGGYAAVSSETACRRDLLGPGSWGVQLTDWTGPKEGLRSLQLVLPSVSRPQDFYLGLVFGDFFVGTVHEIETRRGAPAIRGEGRATVIHDRQTRIVAVSGKTQDGVAIAATITCQERQAKKGRTR